MTRRTAVIGALLLLVAGLGAVAWAAFAPFPEAARALTFVIPPVPRRV